MRLDKRVKESMQAELRAIREQLLRTAEARFSTIFQDYDAEYNVKWDEFVEAHARGYAYSVYIKSDGLTLRTHPPFESFSLMRGGKQSVEFKDSKGLGCN